VFCKKTKTQKDLKKNRFVTGQHKTTCTFLSPPFTFFKQQMDRQLFSPKKKKKSEKEILSHLILLGPFVASKRGKPLKNLQAISCGPLEKQNKQKKLVLFNL